MLIFWLKIFIWLHIRDSFQQEFQCGVRQIKATGLVVYGSGTSPGEWPWHVAIYHRTVRRENTYVCGGTLLNEQFILTAAHCVVSTKNGYQLATDRIFVRMGVHDLDALNSESLQQHGIGKIHKHANYSNRNLRNDIALLELDTLVQFNEFVQPVCVNRVRDIAGEYATAIGWGLTEDDNVSGVLRKVEMPIVDVITCLKSNRVLFGKTLDEGVLCAGYMNGTSVCNGDSGGGLFINRGNVWYLAGIVSYSESRFNDTRRCRTDGYGAFTIVQHYLPWITQITEPYDENTNDHATCDAAKGSISRLPMNCGPYVVNQIEDGEKANLFEFPWMALLQDGDIFFCTGTLIHKRYVMTSGYCAHNARRQPRYIRLGEHTMNQSKDCNVNEYENECAPPVRDYAIECIIEHPEFKLDTLENDIALIRLNQDVMFEDHIQPICLPVTPALQNAVIPQYIIAGWDENSQNQKNPLLKGTIVHAKISDCMKWYESIIGRISDSQICARENTSNQCYVDIGSPLGYVAQHRGVRFVQFGITSFGAICREDAPQVYTRVASFMDWIKANLKE